MFSWQRPRWIFCLNIVLCCVRGGLDKNHFLILVPGWLFRRLTWPNCATRLTSGGSIRRQLRTTPYWSSWHHLERHRFNPLGFQLTALKRTQNIGSRTPNTRKPSGNSTCPEVSCLIVVGLWVQCLWSTKTRSFEDCFAKYFQSLDSTPFSDNLIVWPRQPTLADGTHTSGIMKPYSTSLGC